ncbi:hypothetical protein WJX72_008306 [[Myrmecia] bisecta]|uniref:GDT1 family protein n=1 Tax=[Myrmecia] bisecta TaxID=41462 RepID=A0AAW1QAU4_9CHLO
MVNMDDVVEGFLKSWGMILVSEIGDKTFFIAAVMAMKNRRRTVFAGAIGALATMTALSAAMGWAAPNLISKQYTHYGAVILFLAFGVRMLYETLFGGDKEGESELEEVERELQLSKKEGSSNSLSSASAGDARSPKRRPGGLKRFLRRFLSPVLMEAFVLTFLAEWGDRSQIATIGLAASIDPYGVTLGGILGHMICTGVAVVGGRQLATRISERTVSILGGLLFLAFGLHELWYG